MRTGNQKRELGTIPGSFLWRHISDRWLLGSTASAFFAASAIIITAMSVILIGGVQLPTDNVFENLIVGAAGVLSGLSVFFLWGGMWSYWIRCDQSSRTVRRLTFLMLLIGIWYGAILYYVLVYIPGARTRGNEPE